MFVCLYVIYFDAMNKDTKIKSMDCVKQTGKRYQSSLGLTLSLSWGLGNEQGCKKYELSKILTFFVIDCPILNHKKSQIV